MWLIDERGGEDEEDEEEDVFVVVEYLKYYQVRGMPASKSVVYF